MCHSLIARGHLCDQGAASRARGQRVSWGCVCGMSLAPWDGKDVRTDLVWILGVISFEDFCDLKV